MDTNDIRPAVEEQIENTLDKGKIHNFIHMYLYNIYFNRIFLKFIILGIYIIIL